MHLHHGHEDDLFTPMLKEKVNYPAKLEADHDELLKVLTAVTDEVAKLAVGGSVAAVTTVFDTYTAMMKAHLTEEEGICVPLMRAYFDFKEVNKKFGEIMQVMDPTLMGAFVHHQGTKKEIQTFMAQERIPGFVWYVQFKGVRSKYRAVMKTQIEALLTNTAPAKKLTAKKDLQTAMNCGNYEWKITA